MPEKKKTIYIHVGIKKKGWLGGLLKDQILLILLETPKKSSGFRPLILFPISSFNRSTALPQLPHARQHRRRLKVTEVCGDGGLFVRGKPAFFHDTKGYPTKYPIDHYKPISNCLSYKYHQLSLFKKY